MSQRTIIIAAVVGLFVLGGAGFVLFQNSQSKTATSQLQTNTNPQPNTETVSGTPLEKKSLKDLVMLGGDQTCTFQDTETGNSGKVYMTGGKVRGDFSSSMEGTTINSHMVSDNNTVHIWMDGNNTGFKTSLDKVEQSSSNQNTVDINKQVDYQCSGWSPDNSMFELPSNVKFTDLGNLLPSSLPKITITGSQIQPNTATCDVCNNLTGDSKAQCLVALKCN